MFSRAIEGTSIARRSTISDDDPTRDLCVSDAYAREYVNLRGRRKRASEACRYPTPKTRNDFARACANLDGAAKSVGEIWRARMYCSLSSPLRRFSAKRDSNAYCAPSGSPLSREQTERCSTPVGMCARLFGALSAANGLDLIRSKLRASVTRNDDTDAATYEKRLATAFPIGTSSVSTSF